MSQQQTVLRVLTNIPGEISGTTQYDFLDLYSDIPIKINKSISEIEDISKKNSDFSIGLNLPGSKKNNKFFESFFNVDSQSLYFNANQRVNCDVLLNDQSYFKGYLRLNKVSVLNSKVEYDVTLYSTVGELFGLIGNNLLKDLNYTDSSYTFNHTFDLNIASVFSTLSNFDLNRENPYPYFYPIVHNGYEYSGNTVNFSGSTSGSTRFYTSTSPISGFTSLTGATSAGAELYSINSPATSTNGGLVDNQLKPGLSIWNLIKLIFKTYGYTIKSDFFNTPWFKGLYMYGYFSSELTKFGYKITNIQQLPLEGVELIIDGDEVYVCKLDTGIPCYCSAEIVGYAYPLIGSPVRFVIPAGTYGVLLPPSTYTPYQELTQVPFADISTLKYVPQPVGTTKTYVDGDYVNFNLVIDQNIKQIDLLSSIAKKFDLVFIPDPDVPNQLIIEPYDYYIGTGEIHDWTPLLSFDKGFTVQPALNNIESNLVLTDLEDQDEGNRIFKNQNNRIYGQNNIYNITDFKSQEKKIDTIFSAELIRKWDKDGVDNINVPLGINYAASNNEAGNTNNSEVLWSYKGVKTKPKLIYWLGPFNPFNGTQGQAYNSTSLISSTYTIKMQASTGTTVGVFTTIPVISHTIPMGLSDEEKINNDSLCILFNSELPSNIGVQTFNTYTNNDIYNSFYGRRIGNLYNPNTRFVDGYFDLKYSDIQNLKWNDLIKVNEQYFTVNKIDGYNLTNRELTKVELIQYNTAPQIYPTRYFKYTYCDGSGCYKFKTNFTQKKLRDTNFSWSVWYDHNSGVLGGLNTGFVSTINYSVTGTTYYVPFFIEEITQTEYESVIDGCYDWTCDTLRNYAYTGNTTPFNTRIRSLWSNSTNNKQGLNLFTSCSEFTTIATGNSINVGSSTYFGYNLCVATPTPTPTPTITPTPTPTITMTPTPTITPIPGEGGFMLIANSYSYVAKSITSGTTWTSLTGLTGALNSGVAISYDGQYQGISVNGGPLYISNDYGVNWVKPLPFSANTWNLTSIAIGGTGQFMAAARNSSQLYYSSNYGVTWSQRGPSWPYNSVAISDNGKYVVASYSDFLNNGNVFVSSDSGNTMTSVFTYPFNVYPDCVAMSSTGQYMTAVTITSYPSGSPGWILVSNDYGVTWTNTNTTPFILESDMTVSMSATGQYQLVGCNAVTPVVLLSTDFGQTWTNIAGLLPSPAGSSFNTVAVSRYGSYMMVAEKQSAEVYISNNYGATWSKYNQTGVDAVFGAIN